MYQTPPQYPPQPPPPPPPGYGPPPPPGYGPPPQYGPPQAQPPKGLAIAALVLGIVSLAIFCIWYIAIPCGIVAIILGGVAISKCNKGQAAGKGMATAGLVMGIIAIATALILVIIGVSIIASNPELVREMQHY